MSETMVATIYPFTKISEVKPQDPLNILAQSLSLGAVENETNFTSYLWFNSSQYPEEISDVVTISCSSAQHSKTISLKNPGNTYNSIYSSYGDWRL